MLYPMETNMSIQRFVTTPLQVNLFVLAFHLIFCDLLQADEVDTAFVQNYTVVYKAVDAAGNIGSATRTVVIGKSSICISLVIGYFVCRDMNAFVNVFMQCL